MAFEQPPLQTPGQAPPGGAGASPHVGPPEEVLVPIDVPVVAEADGPVAVEPPWPPGPTVVAAPPAPASAEVSSSSITPSTMAVHPATNDKTKRPTVSSQRTNCGALPRVGCLRVAEWFLLLNEMGLCGWLRRLQAKTGPSGGLSRRRRASAPARPCTSAGPRVTPLHRIQSDVRRSALTTLAKSTLVPNSCTCLPGDTSPSPN